MKSKFIYPKLALLALLLGFLAQKFLIADSDLKNGKKDNIEVRDFSESADAQPDTDAPVAYSQTDAPPASPAVEAQDETPAPPPEASESGNVWDFIKANLVALILALMALAELIVRATPTKKDDSIFNFLKSILDSIIPNRRVGGGSH
jgi:hypothetical protein